MQERFITHRNKTSRLINGFKIQNMGYTKEGFENMKQRRNLPFLKRNMKIEVDGKPGKVAGNYGHNLLVKFDGYKISSNCHPHWRTKYFSNDGLLLKEYND